MPVVILGGICGGFFTATEAAAVAVYALGIGSFVWRGIRLASRRPVRRCRRHRLDGDDHVAFAAMVALAPSLLRAPQLVSAMLPSVTRSPAVFLLLVNGFRLVVAMFMGTLAAIIILAPSWCRWRRTPASSTIRAPTGRKPLRITTTQGAAATGLGLAAAPAGAAAHRDAARPRAFGRQRLSCCFTRFDGLTASRTGNRVAVGVESGGVLGGEPRLIQSVRTGVNSGAFVDGFSLETVARDYRVLSLPYLLDDNAQAVRVLQGPTGQRLLGLLERHGMRGVGFGAVYERDIVSRGRAIYAVGDLRGLNIRVLQTPGFVEAYRVLGTQPTPMAHGELFLALQNGAADALVISPDTTVADRFAEAISNDALTTPHRSTIVFIVSKARFTAPPRDIQGTVRGVALESILTGLARPDRVNREGPAAIRARNVAVAAPNLAPFVAEARKSWDTIPAEAPDGRVLVAEIARAKRGGRNRPSQGAASCRPSRRSALRQRMFSIAAGLIGRLRNQSA